MSLFQRAVLALLAVALCAAVWMGRYQLAGDARLRMVLDRWTGAVFLPDLGTR